MKSINTIEQLKSLRADRESFLEGDKTHDFIFERDIQAIDMTLKELEELRAMRRFIINNNLFDKLENSKEWLDFIEKNYNTKES